MHHHADQCGRKMGPQGVNAPARRLSTLTTTTVGAPQLRRGSHLGPQTQPGRHRACQPEPVRGGGEGGRGGRRHQRHLRHRRQLGHQRHLRHLQHLTFRYHDLHDNQKDAMSTYQDATDTTTLRIPCSDHPLHEHKCNKIFRGTYV